MRPDHELTGRRPPGRGRLFVAGAATGVAGVATSALTSALLRLDGSPLLDVAAVIRDLTPGAVAETAIRAVGHADKPLLVAGSGLGLVLVSGLAGTETARRRWLAHLLLVLMGGFALVGVLHEREHPPSAFLPLLVGFGTWLLVLPALTGPLAAQRSSAPGRRAFLLRTGATAVGSLLVLGLSGWWSRGRRRVQQARALLRLPVTRGRVPPGADLEVPGVPRWRTSTDAFYLVHTALAMPAIVPSEWQLRIHGMVDHPLTLSYADLADRSLTEAWITLCCVSNTVGGSLIGNAHWSGVLLRDLLAEAGVHPDADAVKSTSQDGWTCGTPLSALSDPRRDAMLALAMNGKPLPIEHGFPVRMVVPGLYGYVSATKWLVDLDVTRFVDFRAYWTRNGWSEQAPVKTQSRISIPREGSSLLIGGNTFGGAAWAQHTGIAKVEYQLDGGPWREAQIGAAAGTDTWVQWRATAHLEPGRHELRVRATDRSGYTQTPAYADSVPDGATGWDRVRFEAT